MSIHWTGCGIGSLAQAGDVKSANNRSVRPTRDQTVALDNHDIATFTTGRNVAVRLNQICERIRPVHDGCEPPIRDKAEQTGQLLAMVFWSLQARS